MAKMMGFSDFGSKPKKRKIDYQRDAHVPSAESGSGSGSNTMPLGRRRENKAEGSEYGGYDEEEAEAEVEGRGLESTKEHAVGVGANEEGISVKEPQPNEVTGQDATHHSTGVAPHSVGQDKRHPYVGSFSAQTGAKGYFSPSFLEDPWKDLR